MQVNILTALYKLADDIIHSDESGHRNVRFDVSLLDRGKYDTNEISLTLKNYERPNGVATQIFDVPLHDFKKTMGYGKHNSLFTSSIANESPSS